MFVTTVGSFNVIPPYEYRYTYATFRNDEGSFGPGKGFFAVKGVGIPLVGVPAAKFDAVPTTVNLDYTIPTKFANVSFATTMSIQPSTSTSVASTPMALPGRPTPATSVTSSNFPFP